MRKLISYCMMLLLGMNVIPSISQVSSNRKVLKYNNDVPDIFVYLDSANYLLNNDPLKAYDFVEQAVELSITNQDKRGEAYSYLTLGKINFQLAQYDFSVENYLKAISLFTIIEDQEELYETYRFLGKSYELNEQYDYCLNTYFSFLEKANIRNNQDDIIITKNNIGNLYFIQGRFDLAKKTYEEVLKLEKERNNRRGIIEAQDNLGRISLEQEKTDEALGYYKSSQVMAEELEDDAVQSKSLDNLGKVFKKNKNLNKELEVRQQSLALNTARRDIPAQTKDNIDIGRIYIDQDKEEEAIPYLQRGINLSNASGNIEHKKVALKTLSKAYDKSRNYDKSLEVYKEYVAVTDSFHKIKEQEIFASLELSTSLNKKQQRIELLEKDKELTDKTIELLQQEQLLKDEELKNQDLIIYSLISGLMILLIASYFVYKSARQKRIANQLLALKSLRSQMNPHFIFNALNSVNSFIAKSDERTANKYLSEFARLMRLVMENSQHDFISLTEEVLILDLYLRLEHLRFEEKFDYCFHVDQSIDVDAFLIPPMLIQPYIENGVWHGLRYKETKGHLDVSIKQNDGMLQVIITDNGIGRVKSQEIKTKNQKEQTSTGIKNIESRLNIINDVHKTKIFVIIEDLNPEDKTGTKVIISIPEHNNE